MKSINGLFVWLIVTLYVVYSFSLNTAAAVFSSAIQTSLQTTAIQTTIAIAMFILGFALMQIPAGYLLDRYRARMIVSAGILILAAGNLLTAYSNNVMLFSIANFLQGIGASFAFIAAGVLIGQWFKLVLFPILFGLTQTTSCTLSGILHYVFSAALVKNSWNTLYLYLSLAGFVLFILSCMLVKNPSNLKLKSETSLLGSLKIVCSSSQLWLCTIAASMSFGVLLSYASFWYIKVQEYYDVSTPNSMIISAAIFLGIGVGTPLLGYISNVVKSRKMVIHVSLSLGVICLLAGIYLPNFKINSLIIINIVSFLIGFFLSGSMLFYTVINEIFPTQVKGVALSVANTGVFLTNSLMLLIPYSLTTSKVFFTSLWLLPALTMISILVLYFVKESYPNK